MSLRITLTFTGDRWRAAADRPTPEAVDAVVEWAERRARGEQQCPAVAYDHGAAVRCETSDGHTGEVHRNDQHGINWIQTISRSPSGGTVRLNRQMKAPPGGVPVQVEGGPYLGTATVRASDGWLVIANPEPFLARAVRGVS